MHWLNPDQTVSDMLESSQIHYISQSWCLATCQSSRIAQEKEQQSMKLALILKLHPVLDHNRTFQIVLPSHSSTAGTTTEQSTQSQRIQEIMA